MESHKSSDVNTETDTDGGQASSYNTSSSDIVLTSLGITAVFMLIIFVSTCIRVLILGQKTRSPQQRRMYAGSRARTSLGPHEPTIYVSPSNLPPPPKYECMAPPSYEEVVGVHYPNYQVQQPITQPIAAALAQTQPSTTAQSNDTQPNDTPTYEQATVVTVNERPTAMSS